MKRAVTTTIVIAFIWVAVGSFAQGTPPPATKFLTVGDIGKLDAKNKSITIKDAFSYNIEQLGNLGAGTGAGNGRDSSGASRGAPSGGRRGGGGRGGGGRGDYSGGAVASGGRGAAGLPTKEYKVVISSMTVLKEGDKEIKFEDLKMGDNIQVFSPKNGSKLDATEIVVVPKN